MGTIAAARLNRLRTGLCALAFAADVSLRLSPLPIWESLAPHSIADLLIATVAIAVAWASVLLARRSRVGRALSICIAALAVLSVTAQIAKIYLAYDGHRSLRFADHVLATPHGDLVDFNVPLILAYTADILLWLFAVALSIASTRGKKT
ncbi:hypothetical protein ABZ942_35665 [Nocardia sp. NPDC046473]|uniref:hypothetical protein n=1 Tax=Nocardia sp. NPDC046473 TaxID=3155733 RepID=UPI0033DDFE61